METTQESKLIKCDCGSNKINKTFIESGKWLGSSSSRMRKYSLTDERFITREYSLGFDFYAKEDMFQTTCRECGKNDFVINLIVL